MADNRSFPAGRRRAGDGLDKVMAAHLQEAAVVMPFLTGEDRLHRRLHVVVDAPCAGALEEGEGPVMRVKHHLLALAHVGPGEHHPAVAQPDMRHLHRHRDARDHHDLMAPVELVSLARCIIERHIGFRCHRAPGLRPALRKPAHGIIAALVSEPAQLLEDPDQRQPFPRRLVRVGRKELFKLPLPRPDPRHRLPLTFVAEVRLVRPQDLAHCVPRYVQVPHNLLHRPA
jgi:hypothetical protein